MEAEHITAIWSRKFKDLLSRMISLIQKQQNNKNIHKYIQKINILDITIINKLIIDECFSTRSQRNKRRCQTDGIFSDHLWCLK